MDRENWPGSSLIKLLTKIARVPGSSHMFLIVQYAHFLLNVVP